MLLLEELLCLPASAEDKKLASLEDLKGQPIAMIDGAGYEEMLEENERIGPGQDCRYYQTESDCVQALRDKKVKSAIIITSALQGFLDAYDDIILFPEPFGTVEYAFGFPKGSEILEPFNEAMRQLKAEGTADQLEEKWLQEGLTELPKMKEQSWAGENGTLKFWINTGLPPMAYIDENGAIAGFTPDYVLHIAEKMDCKVEMTECAFSGLIPALMSGRADLAGRSIMITEERKQSVDFSDPFLEESQFFLVRKADVAAELLSQEGTRDEKKSSLFEILSQKFTATFLLENRWKLFLSGIGITLLITFSSALIGSLLGFLLYLLIRKKHKRLNRAIQAVNGFISGIPAVVVLMLLYYIIFKKTELNGVTISIIGFSVLFAISSEGLIENGVMAVGGGQYEGAVALGFSDRQSFLQILFPQALLQILPLLKVRLVEHLKATAIVGYIAVQDLTRMSDIIRSRTFDALFPLAATAVIYYFLGKALLLLMDWLEKKNSPEGKVGRLLKGVTLR